jgi:hypothetical protein
MESDWEIELGGDAPVIDARWPGFIDLRLTPSRAAQLPEAVQLPVLAPALVQFNAPSSPVWTAKCDVWPVIEFDPDELDAPPESALHAVACYIDLLPRNAKQWSTPELAIAWCKSVCDLLRPRHIRCCRVDLILRRALLTPEHSAIGITAYFTACGQTFSDASAVLASALAVFADSIRPPFASHPSRFTATIKKHMGE